MLYLVLQDVVSAVIFCYHLFSLGSLFVKSEKMLHGFERARRRKGGEEKKAMVALLVTRFTMATLEILRFQKSG